MALQKCLFGRLQWQDEYRILADFLESERGHHYDRHRDIICGSRESAAETQYHAAVYENRY